MSESMLSFRPRPNEFMCRCDPESVEKCEAALALARKIVSVNLPAENDLDFVDRMLYWLVLDGDVEIAADQWAAIIVKPFDQPSDKITESVRIQCDRITDGLAAAIVFYYGKQGE